MIVSSNIGSAFLDSLKYVFENGFEPFDPEIKIESPILIKIQNVSEILLEQELSTLKESLLPFYPDLIEQYNFEKSFYETELFDKLEMVISIIKDKTDSRKLFFNFWKSGDESQENKSPCLTNIYFRQNMNQSLDMHVSLRANNAVKVSAINMLLFVEFGQKVAKKLNLKINDYYHYSNSYHIYKKDFNLAKQILQK